MPEQGLKLVMAVPRLEGRSASAFAFWRERRKRPIGLGLGHKKREGRSLRFVQLALFAGGYEQPLVVPQLTHLWQLPLGIMIDPHSGQVGASVRAMKL